MVSFCVFHLKFHWLVYFAVLCEMANVVTIEYVTAV